MQNDGVVVEQGLQVEELDDVVQLWIRQDVVDQDSQPKGCNRWAILEPIALRQ